VVSVLGVLLIILGLYKKLLPGMSLIIIAAFVMLAVGGCAGHPLAAEWVDLSGEEREARALETVGSAFAERGSRTSGCPGEPENKIIFADRRLIVFRPLEGGPAGPRAGVPGPRVRVLLFRDISGIERRVLYDFPGQPEDLSLYLLRGAPSAHGVFADRSLLSRIGLGWPILHLRSRPRGTHRRLRAALEYLLALPRPVEGPSPAIEKLMRRLAGGEVDRGGFEEGVLRTLEGRRKSRKGTKAGREADRRPSSP
jgi:hypothetical protein